MNNLCAHESFITSVLLKGWCFTAPKVFMRESSVVKTVSPACQVDSRALRRAGERAENPAS